MYIPSKTLVLILNDSMLSDTEKVNKLLTILSTKKIPKKSETTAPLIVIEKKEVRVDF
jgi:hypothetical protein